MSNTYTSEEDLAAGWLDSDWMHHEKKSGEDKLGEPGGVEQWRFQLSRRLTPIERNKVALRDEEYHDPDVVRFNPDDLPPDVDPEALKPKPTVTFNINRLLAVIREIAPDVTVVRARIDGKEARKILEWVPQYNHETGMALHSMDGFRDFTPQDLLTYDQFKQRAVYCTQGPIR